MRLSIIDMKKAIVIGATSGIGRELAKVLSQNNYIVGLVGRRVELLSELQREISTETYIKRIDLAKTTEAMSLLEELIREMGGMDVVVISSGVGFINPDLNWEQEKETTGVNVSGFAAVANVAVKHFWKQGSGQVVAYLLMQLLEVVAIQRLTMHRKLLYRIIWKD